jgi:hypothetical protein
MVIRINEYALGERTEGSGVYSAENHHLKYYKTKY